MDCGIRNREGDMSHHKVSPKKDGEARLKRALTIAGTIAGQCNGLKCVLLFVVRFIAHFGRQREIGGKQ